MTASIISLGYIVRYYDELPSFTLFLHGHDDHWHQIYNMHYIVHHLDFSQTYRNINNYWVNDRNSSSNTYMRRLQLLWNELFQDELGPMPSQVSPSARLTMSKLLYSSIPSFCCSSRTSVARRCWSIAMPYGCDPLTSTAAWTGS